jgi:hypothetical protein
MIAGSGTTPPLPDIGISVKRSEVAMNAPAITQVSLPMNVALAAPNMVWLEPPPKAAPSEAPFPACSNTTRISPVQQATCMTSSKMPTIFML